MLKQIILKGSAKSRQTVGATLDMVTFQGRCSVRARRLTPTPAVTTVVDEMIDLKTKQAFWSEQLPFFKEKYWIPGHLDVLEFDMNAGCFDIAEGVKTDLSEEDLFDFTREGSTY